MANALVSPHIFEIAFDALTAAVGGLVILLALRVAPGLTLSSHRLALRISIVAAVLITAAQTAEVLADFSRLSTIEDAAADVAELIAVCFVGLALHLIGRAEKGEISSLRRAANVDHLTGLVSRSYFHRAAERRIELYKRNGLPLACAVLDVDNFKSYNDRYGHGSGDEALRCVGRVLRKSTRADDVVARYGGEEFVVLMGGNIEDAIEVAERVRHGVEHESAIENETLLGSSVTSRWASLLSPRTCPAWSSSSRRQTMSCTGPRERARTGWPPRGDGKTSSGPPSRARRARRRARDPTLFAVTTRPLAYSQRGRRLLRPSR